MLVATDVAARGIDLDDIGLVVNYDPPEDADAYTHRVGRTARAGRTGRAVTLVAPDQADALAAHRRRRSASATSGPTRASRLAAPRVVYGSRRRGSAFSPSRPARPRPTGGQPAPGPRNRVKRGSRTPAA